MLTSMKFLSDMASRLIRPMQIPPTQRVRAGLRRVLALLLLFLLVTPALAQELRIGVLALRGEEKALESWSATAEYLQSRLPGYQVSIVPLDFDDIDLAVRQHRIDFILTNPSFYVELETLYGATPVVTRKSCHKSLGAPSSQFGGVIFTRADRQDIRDIRDLNERSLGAVDPNSFGGWHVAWRELLKQGIDPEKDLKALRFLGTHDAVVRAVLSGEVDAGTVRSETLEQMAAEGEIHLEDLYVLNSRPVAGFPFLLSTPLYPEWPLARLPGVADELAIDVAIALMQMPGGHPALSASQTAGWTLPLNYQPVLDTLKELRIGPYEYLRSLSLRDVWRAYGLWVVIGGLALTLALLVIAYVIRLNARLQQNHAALQQLNDTLGERVQERTEKITHLLQREHYLRGIVETVADVNQIIITAETAADMLRASCDRLIAHQDYRFAWVGLLDDNGKLGVSSRSWGSGNSIRLLTRLDPDTAAVRCLQENRTLTEHIDCKALFGGMRVNAQAALPLRKDAFATPLGILCVYTSHPEGFEDEEVSMLEQLAGDIGFAIQAFGQELATEHLQQERIHYYEETILSMVDMIEKRDPYTAGHSRRVADYAVRIAQELGIVHEQIEKLQRAAILHDIGKIAIPDAVLLKPGRFTPLEYELIKQHVEVGYQTLSHIEMYKELAEIMRYHHERLDGSGYPQGLRGGQIPFLAQIMAVADAFDAMTTERIYKKRKAVSAALADLLALADVHFARTAVEAAARVLKDITLPPSLDQLPKSPLEKQRFAYFFNDALTGLHNGDYLKVLLAGQQFQAHPHATLIELHDFSAYGAQQGWAKSERLLCSVADALTRKYPDATAFRILGDDFVLLSKGRLNISAQSIQDGPLSGSGVRAEVRHFELEQGGAVELEALLA